MDFDIGIKTINRISSIVLLPCAQAFRFPFGKLNSKFFSLLISVLMFGLLSWSTAWAAGDPALGQTAFGSAGTVCSGCHTIVAPNYQTYAVSTYALSSLANAPSTISSAANSPGINTSFASMGASYGALLGTAAAPSNTSKDIAAYIGTFVTPTVATQSTSVSANTSSNPIDMSASITVGTPVSILVTPGASIHGSVSAGSVVASGVSGGNVVTSVTYTPTAGYAGAASFTYTVTNSGGTSASATVNITVNAVVPNPPTIGTATPGNGQATVSFTPPANTGGSTILDYTVTCAAGKTATGAASPLTVTGLTNNSPYTCTVTARNIVGSSANSGGASVTPLPPPSVTNVTPISGLISGGTSVTITGTNLGSATSVLFGATAAAIGANTSTSITATAPIHSAGLVDITVTTSSGTSPISVSDQFTYYPPTPITGNTTATANFCVTGGCTATTGIAPNITNTVAGATVSSVAIASPASKGVAAVSGTTFTYTPNPGSYGTDTFTYTATGPNGTPSNTSTVTVTISNPPTPITANTTASASYCATGPCTGTSGIVPNITNAVSAGAIATSVSVIAQGTLGVATVSGATFTYTPNVGTFGTDSFTYNATGPNVTASNTSTVTVTIGNPPSPVANVSAPSVSFNSTSNIITPLFTGVVNTAGIAVTVAALHGTATASLTNNTVTYTSTTGYYGPDSFSYTITGPGGTSNVAVVSITVGNPPTPVTAGTTASASYCASGPCTMTTGITPIITNSASQGAIATSVAVASPATKGTASVSGTTFTYTPNAGSYGTDTFTYTATGPNGTASNTSTVTVTIANPPTPVVGSVTANTSYCAAPCAGTTGISPNIANAASAGAIATSVAVVAQGTKGTATVVGATFTYIPNVGIYGTTDSFTYTAKGPNGTASNTSTVLVTIGNPPAPGASAASVSVTYNSVSNLITPSVSGVVNTPGITISSAPAHGIATASSVNNTITYTSTSGYYGPDSFTYTISGPGGSSSAATVSVTVGLPPVPTASASSATVAFNSSANVITPTIAGVVNPAGINVTILPLHGTATASGVNNTVSYTPTTGYFGADSFSYSIAGPGGTSAAAIVSITVGNPPPPTASNAAMQVQLNASATLDLASFISGIAVSGVGVSTQPAHGIVSVSGTKVTYTPTKDYFGTDIFNYVAYGVGGKSNAAMVTVTIIGRPDPTKDARVTGLINIQTATVKRFGMVQVFNFQQRLESRHHAANNPLPAGSPGESSTPAPAGGALPGQNRGYFNSWQPGTVLAYANDPNTLLLAPDRLNNGQVASTSAPMIGLMMSAVTGALTSSTLNLGTVSNVIGAAPDDSFSRLEVWAAGNLRFGTTSQAGVNTQFSTDGVSVGVDKRLDRKLTVGMGMGYARDNSSIGTDGTNSTSSGNSVATYASYQTDTGAFLDGLLGYGKVNFNTNRYVTAVNDFARASRTGDQIFGSLSFGYDFRKEDLLWSPYGRYDFAFNRLNEGTESGAGTNALSYASQNVRSSHLAFGMRAQSVHQTTFGVVQPHARFEFQRAFEASGQTSVSYADLLGVQYAVAGTSQNSNAVVLGLGSDFLLSDKLRMAFEYQRLRSTGVDSYQSVNFRLTRTIDGKNDLESLLEESYSSSIDHPSGLTVAAGFAYDDNVSRASEMLDKLSDTIYSMTVNKAHSFAVSRNTKLTVSGFMDIEKFRNYAGLGHVSGGMQGEYMYRTSGEFGAPTFGIFARYTADEYESILRDGSHSSAGVTLRKPLTDRIDLFAAVSDNVRRGKSDVFNTKDVSGRFNLDYALATGETIYLTGEYRKGDIISSGQPSLKILDISTVLVHDDVFAGFYDYRMKGQTVLLTLGYNVSFGSRDSVDIALRRVQSTSDKTPVSASSPMRYIVNQLSISYLMAF